MTETSADTGTLGMLHSDRDPVEHSVEREKPATQGSEDPANVKKTKTKKKKLSKGKDNQQKEMKSTNEEHSEQESVELTPDEQLSRELDWCIEQLELGLRTQKTSSKQKEEAGRALKTLRSSKAPLVKKRQVMRAVSGDYRKKMEEERTRQFKLIQSTMSSARVSAVSELKPVFHRCAERNTQSTHTTEQCQDTQSLRDHPETNEHTTVGERKPFIFTKTQEEFRFNFNL